MVCYRVGAETGEQDLEEWGRVEDLQVPRPEFPASFLLSLLPLSVFPPISFIRFVCKSVGEILFTGACGPY